MLASRPHGRPTPEAQISTSRTRSRRAFRVLAAGLLAAVTLSGAGWDGLVAPGADTSARTSYSGSALRCRLDAPALGAISGLAAAGGRLYLITDNGSVTISTLDGSCRLARLGPLAGAGLPIPSPSRPPSQGRSGPAADRPPGRTGIADVAVGTDGALWLADVGGPARPAVSLYRWPGTGSVAGQFVLRYPDGPRQAEALLLSYAGDAVIVTRAPNGRSAIYAARLPLGARTTLTRVGELDIGAIRAPGDTAPASLLVTGGATAPDGTHFALRTGTALYEWDTPDGDLVRALRGGKPRTVALGTTAGGGVAYAEDSRRLLTVGSTVPAELREMAVTRAPAGADGDDGGSAGLPVLGGAVAVLLLGAGVAVLGRQRRRAATPVTTYQSVG